MIRQGDDDSALDLAAVARDDLLLDVLGGRLGLLEQPAAPTAAGADRTALMLQSLVREVDRGLTEVLAEGLARAEATRPHVEVPALGGRRHRRVVRGTVLAAVLGTTLSVGGVSAAVTGDPLAAYRSVVGVLAPRDDLPPNAAQVAHLNRLVTDARALARAGDPGAAAALEELRTAVAGATDLPPGQRKVLARKLAALEAGLRGAGAAEPKPPAVRGDGTDQGVHGPGGRTERRDAGPGRAEQDREDRDRGKQGGPEHEGEPGTSTRGRGSGSSRVAGVAPADTKAGKAAHDKGASKRR